mmetsp:Transcript_154716/g.494746  ORF Transcript_154716/g.494746 Transcript_154716/m.494746 type:complete len:363 (+) Transcript_154716:1872-2960(+)
MCHSSSCTRDAPSVLPHKPSHASSAPPRCSAHAPPGTHRCDSQVVSSTRSCAPRPHGWGPRPQSLIRSSRISPTSLRSMRSTIFMMPSLTSWMPTSASSPPSTSDSLRSSCSTFLEAAPSTTSTSWWKDRLITTLVATDDHHVARNPRETGSRPRSRRTLTCEGCRHRSLDVHGHGLPSIMRKGSLGRLPRPTAHLDLLGVHLAVLAGFLASDPSRSPSYRACRTPLAAPLGVLLSAGGGTPSIASTFKLFCNMPSIFFVAFLSTSAHSVAKTLSISLVTMSSVICSPTWVSNSTLGEALASSSARDSPFAARGVHKDSSRQSRWRRGARHLLANLLLGSRNPQTGIPSPLVSSYQLSYTTA